MTRTALYRALDAAGSLLYVGITNSPAHRQAQHFEASAWSRHVSVVTYEWHPSRAEAEIAEFAAIKRERPIYNKQYSNRAARRAAAFARYMRDEIAWLIENNPMLDALDEEQAERTQLARWRAEDEAQDARLDALAAAHALHLYTKLFPQR